MRKESSNSRYEESRKRRRSRSREREDRNKRSISPSTREESIEDASLGSRFIGLEVEHMDEHVLRQMGSIEEVVLKDHLGHIHVLGGNSGKCQGSNASIAFHIMRCILLMMEVLVSLGWSTWKGIKNCI